MALLPTGSAGALAIEDEAPRMEESFRELLSSNGIPTDLINLMEK